MKYINYLQREAFYLLYSEYISGPALSYFYQSYYLYFYLSKKCVYFFHLWLIQELDRTVNTFLALMFINRAHLGLIFTSKIEVHYTKSLTDLIVFLLVRKHTIHKAILEMATLLSSMQTSLCTATCSAAHSITYQRPDLFIN